MISWRRGQNLVDLAMIIGVVGLVIVGMEVYIQRGLQGKIKDVSDYFLKSNQAPSDDKMNRTTRTRSDSDRTYEQFKGGKRTLDGTEHTYTHYDQEVEQ